MSYVDIFLFLINIYAIFYETKSLLFTQKNLLPPYINIDDSYLAKQ